MARQVNAAGRRAWHIAFVQHMGRAATLLTHRDEDEVRALRAEGVSPEDASTAMLSRLADRHGQ